MKEYIKAFKNYSNFSGRASRKDYWMFVAVNMGVSLALSAIDFLITSTGLLSFNLLSVIYALVALVPGIAISVRRLHDINKPGTTLFLAFIPFVGFYVLYLYTLPGDEVENDYGPVELTTPDYSSFASIK